MMSDTFFARINKDSPNNNAINLDQNVGAIQITFVATEPNGDRIIDPGPGIDPNTQVLIGNVLYNFEYIVYGTLPNDNKVPADFRGDPVAIIRVFDYPSVGDTERLVFLPESSATQEDMDDFKTGNITPDAQPSQLPDIPVCFVSGTLIETPNGAVAVDNLRQGDLVLTVDDGPQPLVWTTSSSHVWPRSDERFKPIQIKAGALGEGLPRVDLLVSPQHHVLLRNSYCQELFEQSEVIAPAKGLTGIPGVRAMLGKKNVKYFHLLLRKHSLLIVGGLHSESFYPGPTALQMLDDPKRGELLALFPALETSPDTGYGDTVRHRITRRQAELLVEKMRGGAARPNRAA